MADSRPRQNFHSECEEAINKQINMELYSSYVYLSMGYYFERDDVCLPGFAQYFKRCSDEEQEHAQKFMKYQNMRGGRILLQTIVQPAQQEWGNGIDAIRSVLELEKSVNQSLLDMHALAMKNDDPHMCNFLETEYLKEQVGAVKELSDHITNLERVEPGLGEYIFDKTFLKEHD